MKLVTTIVDIHMQALGYLLDVLVQVAAETGQATGIVGFEADVLGSEWCVQDGKRGPSGCCGEFQNTCIAKSAKGLLNNNLSTEYT